MYVMRQWIHRRLDLFSTFDMVSCNKHEDPVSSLENVNQARHSWQQMQHVEDLLVDPQEL